ncbi:hypothetical protein PR202_gb17607 [Eleusine coracana subsp. coracana]|uniref:NB-ARC domain-containing protein n=1 Tax=Eleusine coracana subsp. coracana TaxID=191504 RepID=A0AAV5F125_ELECO|nr:hypothetical protein PR202_gb17607 [Eleusine coracana subsp. coracana]
MNALVNAASWVVGKALAPVTDTVLEAWAASAGLGKNVEARKMELLYVQAILRPWSFCREIEDNPSLEKLLQMLLDHGYEAEDVLDELDYFRIQDHGTFEAASKHNDCCQELVLNARHTTKAVLNKLLCSSACSSPAATPGVETPKLEFNRVDISNRMRLVLDQLQSKRREVSEILRTISSNWNTAPDIANSRPNTTSGSIEPKLYGRDLIMNDIIHDIIEGKHCDKDLIVLPIVGPGGIGKTTLAQHIYHNPRVKNHFQVMVWKCVSLNFNVDKLTEDIEKHIPEVHNEKRGTAVEMIEQRLESKRFMLVLDDIWKWGDEDEWKRLLLPFKKSKVKGNVIIVTTRFPAIANMVKTINHSIELEGLDYEEFKKLFLAFVFGDGQSFKDHTELLEMGYKIMDKLKGSPLAAKTVGRLLRNNLDLDHWTRVLESKEWELQTGDHDIMPALKLSYDYLPFHLQQCFYYCALFPQDYKFDSTELIHFWLGQDILHSGD